MAHSGILWSAHGKPIPKDAVSCRGCCLLCGRTVTLGVPRRNVVKPTFTNLDVLAHSKGTHACCACAFALCEKTFRTTSFICTDEEFTPLKREAIGVALSNLPNTPYLFVVTTSYKKHLWLHAPVNCVPHDCTVQFDELCVSMDINAGVRVLAAIERLYTVFSKTEIESGNYYMNRIEQFGMQKWESLETKLRALRGSVMFKFLLHIANKREDIESCQTTQSQMVTLEELCPKPKHTVPTKRKLGQESQLLLF